MKGLLRIVLAAAMALGAASPVRAAADPLGEVTGVSVQPAPGRADIIINVQGAVDVKDFTLQGPDRLVLDVHGARLTGGAALYDGVNRGGVRDLRYSQYRSDVVRVVLELDGAKSYEIQRTGNEIRVSFGTPRAFVAWSSSEAPMGGAGLAAAAAAEAQADAGDEAALVQTAAVNVEAREAYQYKPARERAEPRITVTWDRASIADVVAGFAALSGRTIILGKDITGDVSAEIKNQPWSQAFAAILAAQGLSAQEMPGGIIRVDNPGTLLALDSLEPLETALIKINYKQADSLAKSIESVLTKGRGRVVADKSTNSLIITDTRSKLPGVEEFVRTLDTRTPQVAIQAKIIFVDRTHIEQLGVKYDLGSNNQFFNKLIQRCCDPTSGEPYDPDVSVVNLGGNAVSGIANAEADIAGSAIDLIFSTAIGGFKLTTFLSALERVELSDVQAEPLISTLDNQTADILVGEETPVRVIDANSQAGSSAARAVVQFKETGIRLTVTPHVTNNRQILMSLRTERSAIQLLTAADLGYVFAKQKAENQLLVNDGETAVIGGLTVTSVTHNRSGIPLLGSLPVVGKLFSFTEDRESRRDLIILVTPRIVDEGYQGAP
ncbi:MAG: AMIN domain-containing protein [Gemmatimonadota bacterium]|nr:AMIN domain-containing protein [Gemmatimonadota bacterium]